MSLLLDSPVIDRITSFLDRAGIAWRESSLTDSEILPGIRLEEGLLTFDREHLKWPGDLLHEAGHLAVTPPSRRAALTGTLEVEPADEMAALAWSYAAALACGIDPLIVFHEGGYKAGGAQLAQQFAHGSGPGVPMLQWYRMTTAFPQMSRWLREVEDPTSDLPTPS